MRNGHIYLIDEVDEEYSQLESHWPKKADGKLVGIALRKNQKPIALGHFTHRSLFYSYRNLCLHEFRSAGTDFNLSRRNQPNYHSSRIAFRKKDDWSLTYPIEFFAEIAETMSLNLHKWLKAKQKDPYKSFKYSAFWIDQVQ